MKSKATIKTVEEIGGDSWDLLNFQQLPDNATPNVQIAALREDQRWQADHHNEVSKRIDYLIQDIEKASDHDGERTDG